MRFKGWTIDQLIHFLKEIQHAPTDRFDPHCVQVVRGEIFIENGEQTTKVERSAFEITIVGKTEER